MNLKKAARILGLITTDGLTVDDVNKAFAAAARAAHPDTLAEVDANVLRSATMTELKTARDTLRAHTERMASLEDCPKCGGSGEVPTRRGISIKCPTCGGDGVIRRKEVKRG